MNKKNIKIAPSILAGDFGKLAAEAERAAAAGADAIHIDVMDGHFVPNISMGPQAVAAINRATDAFLDVHIMIYNPYEYIERLVQAGADQITFHFEATEDVEETLKYIRKCNARAGLAFCPETSPSFIDRFLDKCDNLLLMTVNPGFGGQAFISEVLEKIRYVRELCDQRNVGEGDAVGKNKKRLPIDIQVDGGINEETGRLCIEAGANVLVAGTYLFQFEDMSEGIRKLRFEQ